MIWPGLIMAWNEQNVRPRYGEGEECDVVRGWGREGGREGARGREGRRSIGDNSLM